MINEALECKICDFGISNISRNTNKKNTKLYTSLIPPECREFGEFTKKSDVYFFGWVLVELFTQKSYRNVFTINDVLQILNREDSSNLKRKEFENLMLRCLQNVSNSIEIIIKLIIKN